MTDFLTINGITIDVKVLSASRSLEALAGTPLAGGGEVIDQRRQVRRRWRMTTVCKSRSEARALQALIEGYAHTCRMHGETCMSTSLTPSTVPASMKLLMGGGFGGGCVYIDSGSMAYAEAALEGEEWTAMAWATSNVTFVTKHVAIRSDGAQFVDGVRVPSLGEDFSLLYFSPGINLQAKDHEGNSIDMYFSGLVVMKAALPDDWIAQVAAWDAYWGDAPLLHCEGSMIDSPLGIFANGLVSAGTFITKGGYEVRDGHPEDEAFANNEVELDFTIVEDDRAASIDTIPLASIYAPLTERANVTNGAVVYVVTDNDLNGTTAVVPILIDPPGGEDRWAQWTSGGMLFTDGLLAEVDGESRFSVSVWLMLPTALAAQDLVADFESAGDQAWRLYLDVDGKLSFEVYDTANGTSRKVRTESAVARDQWIHVVCVHDTRGVKAALQPGVVGIFVDGIEPEQTQIGGGTFDSVNVINAIGVPNTGLTVDIEYGIAHLAGFPLRALTREEVRTIYRLGRRGAWLRRV